MAILVTGGAGYIGSHMVWKLLDRGEDVIVIDDLSRGERSLVPAQVKFYQGNVGNTALLSSIFRENDIEAVIHFAGYIIVPESMKVPMLYYERNTSASAALIQSCVLHGIEKFIFSSTAAVYGIPDILPIPENSAIRAISPYGRSKIMTEQMLQDADEAHGLKSVFLRYFNVAGADAEGRTGQVSQIPTHLLKIASMVATGARPKISIYGDDYPTPDGTCVRDYVHVTDLVEAHYLALGHLRDGNASRAFNCGYGRGYSVMDIIKAYGEVTGRPLPHDIAGRRPGDPPTLVADSSRLQRELGWRPRFNDLPKIIESAMAWERSWQSTTEGTGTDRRVVAA